MSYVWAILTFLNNLWSAWREFLAAQALKRAADAEKRRQNLDQAIDEAKQAKTADEAFEDEEKIVDNSPT